MASRRRAVHFEKDALTKDLQAQVAAKKRRTQRQLEASPEPIAEEDIKMDNGMDEPEAVDQESAEAYLKAQEDMDAELDPELAKVVTHHEGKRAVSLPLALVPTQPVEEDKKAEEDEDEVQCPDPIPRSPSANDDIDVSFGLRKSNYYFKNLSIENDVIMETFFIKKPGTKIKVLSVDSNGDPYIRIRLSWLPKGCPILGPLGAAIYPKVYPYGNLRGTTIFPSEFDKPNPETAEYTVKVGTSGWDRETGLVYQEQTDFQRWLLLLDQKYIKFALSDPKVCALAKKNHVKPVMISQFNDNLKNKIEFLKIQEAGGVTHRKEDKDLLEGKIKPKPGAKDFAEAFMRCYCPIVKTPTAAEPDEHQESGDDYENFKVVSGPEDVEAEEKAPPAEKDHGNTVNFKGKVFRRLGDWEKNKINTIRPANEFEKRLLEREVNELAKIYPLVRNDLPMQNARTMEVIPLKDRRLDHGDIFAPVFHPSVFNYSPSALYATGVRLVPERLLMFKPRIINRDTSATVMSGFTPESIRGAQDYNPNNRPAIFDIASFDANGVAPRLEDMPRVGLITYDE